MSQGARHINSNVNDRRRHHTPNRRSHMRGEVFVGSMSMAPSHSVSLMELIGRFMRRSVVDCGDVTLGQVAVIGGVIGCMLEIVVLAILSNVL